MNTRHQHYRLLLGLDETWDVADVQLDLKANRVSIALTQRPDVRVACPECGVNCSVLLARDLAGTTQLVMDEKAQGAGHDENAANIAWKCVESVQTQITGVALDMWPAYTMAAAAHAPQADLVHDRFH